jgi:hypothetical protein
MTKRFSRHLSGGQYTCFCAVLSARHGGHLRGRKWLIFSLRTKDGKDPIRNLEYGNAATKWGRLIFHVSDVDGFWGVLQGKGLHPESRRDASWGERNFHMCDPDGHELSFARPV